MQKSYTMMKLKIIIILAFFTVGCKTYSQVNTLAENNKDVLILSLLIQDHFRNKNDQDFNLKDIVQYDTLRRISNNFKTIELKRHGGYIAVYYKYSDIRDVKKIELNDKEREMINNLKWIVKDLKNQDDGEIQFDYGERFYSIRKIIINH
jgi:hypothetical protein